MNASIMDFSASVRQEAIKMMRASKHLVLVLALFGMAGMAWASVTVDALPTVPGDGNAVIKANLGQNAPASPRLYFRRHGYGDFYYVTMQPAGGGLYWGVLPKADPATERIEYFVAIHDAKGAEIERSSSFVSPVKKGVQTPLTSDQAVVAGSLTVTDSTPAQHGHAVAWFSNTGISKRVDASGAVQASPGPSGQGGSGTDALGNVIVVGDPGPTPAPKEVSLPRP